MIKVKEYLDLNFRQDEPSYSELKKNGHYCVMGSWSYPLDLDMKNYNTLSKMTNYSTNQMPDHIILTCNNETIIVGRMCINNEMVGEYYHLQTYEHILRGEPDENGYYARSTDDEVIRYINEYLLKIKEREND